MSAEQAILVTSVGRSTPSVRTVQAGTVWSLKTADFCSGKLSSAPASYGCLKQPRCPVAGPIDIEDANQGDTLEVKIHKIDCEPIGVVARFDGIGPLSLAPDVTKVWDAEIGNDWISVAGLDIRPRLMIGVLGVRPDSDDPIPTRYAGFFGGNMDTAEISTGTVVDLPVFTPGAGLFAGDLHAAMGDGELSGTGVECAGEISLSVRVRKNKLIPGPRLRRGTCWFTIHTAPNFYDALKAAATHLRNWIIEDLRVNEDQAALLVGLAADLGISQAVASSGVTAKLKLDWSRIKNPPHPLESSLGDP